jgi:hypothetical protein
LWCSVNVVEILVLAAGRHVGFEFSASFTRLVVVETPKFAAGRHHFVVSATSWPLLRFYSCWSASELSQHLLLVGTLFEIQNSLLVGIFLWFQPLLRFYSCWSASELSQHLVRCLKFKIRCWSAQPLNFSFVTFFLQFMQWWDQV